MNALTVIAQPALPVELAECLERAADYARKSKAESTLAAYATDVGIYAKWAERHGLPPMPITPAKVIGFLSDEADRGCKPSTISRRVAALKFAAKRAGDDSRPTEHETVKQVVAGIRRTHGALPARKAPVMPELAIAMTADSGSFRALRNRAIILLGFASAMRRSEIVALNVEDIEWRDSGIVVTIRKSKTDQSGEGLGLFISALGFVALRQTFAL